jgi:DNA polymerase III gamma/tau subunit
VPLREIVGQLRNICAKEGVQIDDTSLALLAKKAEGSMRDSQSLLDQVIAYCGQQVRSDEVARLFGIIDQEIFFACTDAIAGRDVGKGLALSAQIYTGGYHLGEFLEKLSEHLSNILTARVTNSAAHLFGLEGYVERYKQAAAQFSEIELMRCVQMITDTQLKLHRVANPRVLLEMLLLQMIQVGTNAEGAGAEAESRVELKKKPEPIAGSIETLDPATAIPANAGAGVSIIPQIAPKIEAHEVLQERGEQKTSGAERAPRPARSLFDLAASTQKVPVVQAKEASLPRLTNVSDSHAALEKFGNAGRKSSNKSRRKEFRSARFWNWACRCASPTARSKFASIKAAAFKSIPSTIKKPLYRKSSLRRPAIVSV